MKKRRKTVWVVMHYEYIRWGRSMLVDGVQFHVSTSLRKAEEFIRGMWVYPFSWWQIYPYVLDDDDFVTEGETIYYYSHKGTPLRRPPYKRAETAFKRDEEKNRK